MRASEIAQSRQEFGGGGADDLALSRRLLGASPVPVVSDPSLDGFDVSHAFYPGDGTQPPVPVAGRRDFVPPEALRDNGEHESFVRIPRVFEDMPSALGHEIGHALYDQTRTGRALQASTLPSRLAGAGWLGATLGGGLAPTRRTRALSVALGTAATLPSLIPEHAAWNRAATLYRDHGASPAQVAQLATARRAGLKSYWLARPVGTAAWGLGAMGARELYDWNKRRKAPQVDDAHPA